MFKKHTLSCCVLSPGVHVEGNAIFCSAIKVVGVQTLHCAVMKSRTSVFACSVMMYGKRNTKCLKDDLWARGRGSLVAECAEVRRLVAQTQITISVKGYIRLLPGVLQTTIYLASNNILYFSTQQADNDNITTLKMQTVQLHRGLGTNAF